MKILIPTELSKLEGFILRFFQTTLEGGWMNLPFISAQECWDANRLDLGRMSIKPAPHRLCTAATKSVDVLEGA
jgi:hypothetical protein